MWNKKQWMVCSIAVISSAFAQEAPPPSSELLRNAGGANDTWAAVGQFRGPLTCTGALINPSGSDSADARAWLLTAGHCISLEPYGVIRNQPLTATITFQYFVDTADRRVAVRARSTGWSTMKGVDLALVELDATLGELRGRGIRPLRIASVPTPAGSPVYFTGIPQTPIPTDQQYLRRGQCTQGERVQVQEGNWIWHDEVSNDCPDLFGGASGSPLFDAVSGEITGVIGTGTLLNFDEGPDFDCQTNRPCVMRTGGPVMQKNTGYTSLVPSIGACFDPLNSLDVLRSGCPLDPGFQLSIASTPYEVKPVVDNRPATWNASLSGAPRYYAYKHFAAGQGSCTSPAGYTTSVAVASSPVIRDVVGSADGYYFLCVIAGDTPSIDATWQKPEHASARFKRIDSQPPVVPVDYVVDQNLAGYRVSNNTGGGGPSGLGPATMKLGSASSIDCFDPEGYRLQISIPPIIRPADFPQRMCWKAADRAGNLTEPAVFEFGPPAIFPNPIQNGGSLERGSVAPGSVFRVSTFNLTPNSEQSATPKPTLAGVRMSVRDASGQVLPVNLTIAGPLYVEALMPEVASPGTATLTVQPPEGPVLTHVFTIRRSAPGLYYNGIDIAAGFASDNSGNVFPIATCETAERCRFASVPLSTTQGGLYFVLYATGLRTVDKPVAVRIGTHLVTLTGLQPHPTIAGVDEVHLHLPSEFGLRLYQSVSIETAEGVSRPGWIYLE